MIKFGCGVCVIIFPNPNAAKTKFNAEEIKPAFQLNSTRAGDGLETKDGGREGEF
jgi:hypothetical protein